MRALGLLMRTVGWVVLSLWCIAALTIGSVILWALVWGVLWR